MNLRPDVVGGCGLSGGIVALSSSLLGVGHDWAQDVKIESAGTLLRIY